MTRRRYLAALVAVTALTMSCASAAPANDAASAVVASPVALSDECTEAAELLETTVSRITGKLHEDRLTTVRHGRQRTLDAARRAALIVEEAPECFDVTTRVEAAELSDAATTASARPSPTAQVSPSPSPAPPPPPPAPPAPRQPNGELVLAWWGKQSGGGSAGGTACTNIGFTFRNASDTAIHDVTVKFNSSWGWHQGSDEADDGVARSFFEDGSPVTDTRVLGVAPYEEVSLRWELCTPDQYAAIYPGWKGKPFGFSGRPLEFSWNWAQG